MFSLHVLRILETEFGLLSGSAIVRVDLSFQIDWLTKEESGPELSETKSFELERNRISTRASNVDQWIATGAGYAIRPFLNEVRISRDSADSAAATARIACKFNLSVQSVQNR